jgi:hypothetical protein
MNEVVQIIEPATGISGRPLVQPGLHPSYPSLRPERVGPRLTGIHQRLRPLQYLACVNPLDPFAMCTGFPRLGLLRVLRPTPRPSADNAPTRFTRPGRPRADGNPGVVPTFTMNRSSGEVASYAPAVSPRLRRRPSPWPPDRRPETSPGVPHPAMRGRVRTAIQPLSTGFELAGNLRGVTALVPLVHLPVSLAGPGPSGSAGPSRRCRGCSPASPAFPGSACPQLRYAAATAQRRSPSTSARLHGASWRSRSPSQ